jgi:RecA-family ATPase
MPALSAVLAQQQPVIRAVDAHDTLRQQPAPLTWLVAGVLPAATVGDISGPPGVGKSSLVLDLALAIASGTGTWMGRDCAQGKVVLLGGERGGETAFARDLHRLAQGRLPAPGRLVALDSADGHPPMWAYARDKWNLTPWGEAVTAWLQRDPVSLVVLDTQMSVAQGTNQMDNAQQYAFGVTLQSWARDVGRPAVLTVSHTNQVSNSQDLTARLHYYARAGGNGLPGALRWAAGVARLRPDDKLAKELGLSDAAAARWLIAFGVSKSNEMPRSPWNNEQPAVFELQPDGALTFVSHTARVARMERAATVPAAAAEYLRRVQTIQDTLGLEVVLDPENL